MREAEGHQTRLSTTEGRKGATSNDEDIHVELANQLRVLSKDTLIDLLIDLAVKDEESWERIEAHLRNELNSKGRKRKMEDKENLPNTNYDEGANEKDQILLSLFPLSDELAAKVFLKIFFSDGKALGPCRYDTSHQDHFVAH